MLEQYQTEILALVALLVVILIYFMIKSRSSKADDSIKMNESSEELTQIEIDEPVEDVVDDTEENIVSEEAQTEIESVEAKEEPKDEFDGKEEGSFGDTPHQRKADSAPSIEPTHHIKKRDVPPHDKITKDNFKEFAGQRILVAEDNLINQKVISGLLADSGIEITIADDGQECSDILAKDSNYLLVLMNA
ncbi:MAG: response regulator, partial [Campylobacterota bacterium]